MTILAFIILLATPIWILCVHMVVIRTQLRHSIAPIDLSSYTCVAGILLTLLLTFLSQPTLIQTAGFGGLFFMVLIAGMLSHLYMQVFLLSETARRIRILVHIKIGRHEDTEENYVPEKVLILRIKRLLKMRQIRERDGKYFGTPTKLRIAAQFVCWYTQLFLGKGLPQKF